MNSWQKGGTNKSDWHQDEPSLHLKLHLPSHSVVVCLQTGRGDTSLFGELHRTEGFCEYVSARHSHSDLSFVQIWISYWGFSMMVDSSQKIA